MNKLEHFFAENDGKMRLPSSTSIGGKKQGFGVPQNLRELDPQNDRFFRFFEIDLELEKCGIFCQSHIDYEGKTMNLTETYHKNKTFGKPKNTKSLCLERTKNHTFLVKKCVK